jgi:hypothetical protein
MHTDMGSTAKKPTISVWETLPVGAELRRIGRPRARWVRKPGLLVKAHVRNEMPMRKRSGVIFATISLFRIRMHENKSGANEKTKNILRFHSRKS